MVNHMPVSVQPRQLPTVQSMKWPSSNPYSQTSAVTLQPQEQANRGDEHSVTPVGCVTEHDAEAHEETEDRQSGNGIQYQD